MTWYQPQERAMAPGIADPWPEIIKHPESPHGRLKRRQGDPDALRDAAEWLLHVIHGEGKAGGPPEPGEYEDAAKALMKATWDRP